jgi:hypothetical protein
MTEKGREHISGFAGRSITGLMLLFSLFFTGCHQETGKKNPETVQQTASSPKDSEIASLEKKVMAMHNQSMAKMDSLMMLKSRLKDGLKKESAWGDKQKKEAESDIKEIEKVNDAMMDWMHQYKTPDKKWDHDKSISYLNDQYSRISDIDTQMSRQIQKAKRTVSISEHSR